jgi:hypothetical protein
MDFDTHGECCNYFSEIDKCREFLGYLNQLQGMIEAHPQAYDPDEWNTVETIKEKFVETFGYGEKED